MTTLHSSWMSKLCSFMYRSSWISNIKWQINIFLNIQILMTDLFLFASLDGVLLRRKYLCETVLMMGHNICFGWVIWKIIPELSLQPLLIWNTDFFPVRVDCHQEGKQMWKWHSYVSNLRFKSHEQQGHLEMGPQFKVSSKRPGPGCSKHR